MTILDEAPHPAERADQYETRRIRPSQRIPPHNIPAEESVIGACLLSPTAVTTCIDLGLTAADFYKPAHQHIWDAIGTIISAGDQIDAVTVSEELRKGGLLDEVGGLAGIVELQTATPAISNARRYALIILDCATLRKAIGLAGDIAETAYANPDDIPAALARISALTNDLVDTEARTEETTLRSFGELYDPTLERLVSGDGLIRVPTGFTDLDEIFHGGFAAGQFVVLGGRPAMGKSALGLNIAVRAARSFMTSGSGEHVLFATMEMSHHETIVRALSGAANVSSDRFATHGRLGPYEWAQIDQTDIRDLPIFVDDNAAQSVATLRASVEKLRKRGVTIGLVVVDYIQLMRPTRSGQNRTLEVSEITGDLKRLARWRMLGANGEGAPVLGLSQLSRDLESRADKRPMLADLRESGSIEQDADIVMFVYRDEVYNPDSPDRGSAEIIVSKHRGGQIGTRRLVWLAGTTRFETAARGM